MIGDLIQYKCPKCNNTYWVKEGQLKCPECDCNETQ